MTVAWLIPPLILLTGRMVWTRLPSAEETGGDALDEAFASVLCGVFVAGMVGLLLAECGIFRPPVFVAALALLSVGFWRLSPAPVPVSPASRRDLCAAAFVCGLAVAAVAPASEDLLGGRDPGTYANTASWLAREGTLRMRAEALTTIPADTRQLFYAARERGPQTFLYGFFVAGNGATGEIIPQFLHLLPVYLAVGHWLGGLTTAFLVPPLFGVLAALAVFVFVRRMLGAGAAVVAAGMLTLNLAQIWATRIPITEGVSQLGVFVMLWCLTRAIDTAGVRWAVLAAVALGTCFLLRVDALLLLPAVLPPLVLLQNQHPSARWLTHAFLPIALLMAVWGSAHGWLFSRPYVSELGPRIGALWVLTGLVLAVCIAALKQRPASVAVWIYRHGVGLWMMAAIVLSAAFAFGMWVRPHPETFGVLQVGSATRYNEESLVRAGWYFSVPGMISGFVGVLVLLRRWLVHRRVEWSPFVLVLLAFSALYFWRPSIAPDHPWSMRRFVPVIVPGICVAVTVAAAALWSLGGRARLLTRAAGLAIVGTVVWHEMGLVRPFWRFTEKQGLVATIDRIAAAIPRDAVVLFSFPGRDLFVATPLAFHHGRSVLPVVRTPANDAIRGHRSELFEAQIARWLRDGRQVFYLTADDGNSVFATKSVRWEPAGRTGVAIRSFGSSLRNAPRAPTREVIAYHVGRATWVPAALEPCAPAAIRADALLIGRSEGFLHLESPGTLRFRWLRPDARLLFASCDRARGRPRILRIRAACGRRAAASDCRVQVTVNGIAAGTIAPTNDWAIHDLPIPGPAAAAATGPFDIGFSGARPVQATSGLPARRMVSFQLASVALVPGSITGRAATSSPPEANRPEDLNLISPPAEDVWGVSQYGFYGVERSAGRTFRWTDHRARLVVPLGGARPSAVRFEIWRTIRAEQRIRISADKCRLFDGVPPRNEWTAVFPLEACRAGGAKLEITIEADAMRPTGDRRELAVALRSVRLE